MSSASNATEIPPAKTTPITPLMTEDEILAAKANDAKEAAAESLARAKAILLNAVDPRTVTRRHPLIAIGGAALAGFAAAVVAIPSKAQQERRRLEKLEEALHPKPKPEPKPAAPGPAKSPWWVAVLHEAVQLAKPALTAALTSGVARATVKDQSADGEPPTA